MTDADHGESLIDWVGRLICDAGARARLAADPVGVLTEHGLVDLDPTDVHHALLLVAETVGAHLDVLAVSTAPAGRRPVVEPYLRPVTDPTDRLPCSAPYGDASRRTW